MATVSKKKVSKTSILELSKVKNCISRFCTVPFIHVYHYWWKKSFRVFGTGFDRPWARLQIAKKTSFCILVGIYCQNVPTCSPQSGYHGVTEVAKTANIAKMAKKCINCMSARPTPPRTNPMELGPGNTQNRKKPKDS